MNTNREGGRKTTKQKKAVYNLSPDWLTFPAAMPSGKTHDFITVVLTVPFAGMAYAWTHDALAATVCVGALLFGGLMFGPDLDTQSCQYKRWGVFRFLWYPYQVIFAHRSRWSHGLIFGALVRIVYFLGAVTLIAALVIYIRAVFNYGDMPNFAQFSDGWRELGSLARKIFGDRVFAVVFAGLWLGAMSHTVTDITATFIKTGKVKEFL